MPRPQTAKLFLANISYRASDKDLFAWLTEAGFPPREDSGIYRHENGESRGYAFVGVNADVCEEAIASLNGEQFLGRRIAVERAKEKPQEMRKPGQQRYAGHQGVRA
jgi:RNA recognition motif-containing protein